MKKSRKYRINRWIKEHIDFKFQPARAFSKPNTFAMETSRGCNLKCAMCALEMEGGINRGENLSDKVFEKIESYIEYCDGILMNGWNEPLLDKKIFERVKKVLDKGVNTHFNSNGTLLTKEAAQKLVDIPVFHIGFSIDAATKEVYESIREGSNYGEVVENVKYMVDYKKQKGASLPHIIIAFTAMKPNLHDIPKLPILAKELGIDIVNISDVIMYTSEMDEELRYEHDELMKYLEEAREVAKGLNVTVNYTNLHKDMYFKDVEEDLGKREPEFENRICTTTYKSMLILSNGDAFPCCFMVGKPLGNIKDQSIEEIWNGKNYKEVRRRIKNGNPPAVCRICPFLESTRGDKKQYYVG